MAVEEETDKFLLEVLRGKIVSINFKDASKVKVKVLGS